MPLFLFFHDFTVTLISIRANFRKLDSATLKLVGTRILEECPERLVRICTHLADRAESAVRFDRPFDMGELSAAKIKESLELF